MSSKAIEAWIESIAGDKSIFVATNVKAIDPVVDRMVRHLLEIDIIRFIRVSKNDIQASNDLMVKGRTKIPISTPKHPIAVGIHVLFGVYPNAVHFYEITSAVKGYGERMVKAVLKSIPDDWEAAVAMDYSGGFWERMVKKYPNLKIL